MASESSAHFLERAYDADDRKLRVRYLKVSCLLVAALTASGVGLDFSTQGDALKFIGIRAACVFLAFVLFGLCYLKGIERYIRPMGLIWAIMTQASICAMIFSSNDSGSPYYAGLNLIILGISIFLPWTFYETLAICLATLALYAGTLGLMRVKGGANSFDKDTMRAISGNFSFLLFTSTICATASYFTARNRFETFRLRHELDVRNRELTELDRMKTDFFSNISHEFRTPLTLIIAPLDDLLQSDRLDPRTREELSIVQQNSLRLLKLINDLLELVRMEDARSQILKENIDLGSFLPGIVDAVRHLAMNRGVAVHARGANEGAIVSADPGRLEKIILNLLMNAIKFTPSGGKITTSWVKTNENALIEVQDTGIGIAEKDLPLIFERFRQVDSSPRRRFQGTGIGLALAKELVHEHGGTLEVKSEVGVGSTFSITLPVSNGALPVAAKNGTSHVELSEREERMADLPRRADRILPPDAAPAPVGVIGKGDTLILVCDDEQGMRKYVSDCLSEDCRVVQASNGKNGLEVARQYRPDLAVLDLMMPEIDGLALCKMLKSEAETKDIRVILLTARSDEVAKLQALDRGADDFMLKPFSTMELKKRVANLVRSAKLEREVREQNAKLEDAIRQLKATEGQLVQSEKMNALGGLAAGLLHEINNPLNYANMALQVAEEKIPANDEDLRDALNTIKEGIERIAAIISELRAFAVPTAAEGWESFDLAQASNMALRLVSHELDGITVERNLAENVRGSKTQIVQVLVNLMMNAAKALHPVGDREKKINITATRKDSRIVVSVRDNGTGIPKDILAKIFEPFFTTRPVGEGTGLGLSVCHTIVKKHGGELKANSEEGKWTEMTFDLQAAQAGKQT